MNKLLKAAFLLAFLTGCSFYQITSEETTFDYYAPKASANDVLYLAKVDRPHRVIGYVTVNAERNQKRENVLNKLKREAALMGGDGITNIATNQGTGLWAQKKPAYFFGRANIRENYIADVFVFEEPKTPSKP